MRVRICIYGVFFGLQTLPYFISITYSLRTMQINNTHATRKTYEFNGKYYQTVADLSSSV